jgi:hypothetical protein
MYLSLTRGLPIYRVGSRRRKSWREASGHPQVISLAPGDTDTRSGRRGRFFMSGHLAWEIIFDKQPAQATQGH